MHNEYTLGSLFSGIGGFELGFHQAGWDTLWQVEIDPINRAVLADRFPASRQYSDVRNCGRRNLGPVKCVTMGFPCQDISVMGSHGERSGLRGDRSGLFAEGLRIITEIQPQWLVIENVPRLLTIHAGADFEFVIQSLAERGYLGFFRVLDAQYFGVPQRRRRLFIVAGFGKHPPIEFLADSRLVESISTSFGQEQEHPGIDRPLYCLTAPPRRNANRFNLGSENFVSEENGWHQMLERSREAQTHGIRLGLDETNSSEAWSAGNAVCPHIARWIAKLLMN